MIRRFLYLIAGIHRETLATCPATDRLWATHLGFSLLLSFTVVLGISFHATGYVIADLWSRLAVSLVVALTVFMFDRALYQSDWFYQGFLWQPRQRETDGQSDRWRSLWRFLRITVRLGISFGLAWVIALFLELAIFSDTISDKIKRDHLAANQSIFAKIERYEAEQNGAIEQRRKNLGALEGLYREELAAPRRLEAIAPASADELEAQIRSLDAQERDRRSELRQLDEKIATYAQEMNAEELGQKLNPTNSGRAGAGPRYQFAKRQKEVYESQRAAMETDLSQLRARRDDARAMQQRRIAQAMTRRDEDRAATENKREALRSQLELARTELSALELSRLAKLDEFRRKTLASSEFHKPKDDPLSRMTAYQQLKSDPKDGATITLFSWMTKFLVIFLEIVPIVAKMFFSPPSVYAVRIQAEVEREREKAARIPAIANPAEFPLAAIEQGRPLASLPAEGVAKANGASTLTSAPRAAERPSPSLVLPLDAETRSEKPKPASERLGATQADDRAARLRAIEARRRREMEHLVAKEDLIRKTVARTAGTSTEIDLGSGERRGTDMPPLIFTLEDDIAQKP